jgi:hypothetical protein
LAHIHSDWRRAASLAPARNATAVARNWAALAVAVVPIIDAMAVAIVETIAAAKPRDRELNESRKSIAEPIKTRSNSLMDRSISISKTWY